MRDWQPIAVGIGLVSVLVYATCTEGRSVTRWQADTTTVFQGVREREERAESLIVFALRQVAEAADSQASAKRLAQQAQRTYGRAIALRDSLSHLAVPDTCQPYLLIARQSFDSLEGAYRDALEAVRVSNEALGALDSALSAQTQRANLYRESVDSLSALVRRAPGGCKVLGLPCPQLQVGYSAVLSGGVVRVGPAIGLGIRVPFP